MVDRVDTNSPRDDLLVYHVFADDGVEAEALAKYGRVVRVGLDARDENESDPVRADARSFPLRPGADLAVLHPPCNRWAEASRHVPNRDENYENLIPVARNIGERYADEYIIENVPKAPLDDPVVLHGRMFGLPIAMERAFETSFDVVQPPLQATLGDDISWWNEYSRPREWWATVKGYSPDYRKDPLVKTAIPSPFIDYLVRAFLVSTGRHLPDDERESATA